MATCRSMHCDLIFTCEVCNTSENLLLLAVNTCYQNHCTKSTLISVTLQVLCTPAASGSDLCVMQMSIADRTGAWGIIQELLLGSAPSFFCNQADYRKEFVCLVLENMKYVHKAHHTGLSSLRYRNSIISFGKKKFKAVLPLTRSCSHLHPVLICPSPLCTYEY